MKKRVLFIGMGTMGSNMACNLAKSTETHIWNRTPNSERTKKATMAGCILEKSITAYAKEADIVFTCLPSFHQLEEIFFTRYNIAEACKKGCIVVDCSTIGKKAAVQLSHKLSEHGVDFLDAPVSGGDIGAQEGTLTFMVGGDQNNYQSILPYFNLMGKHIHYCGNTGSGQSIKLVNQALCAVHMVALSEAISLAKKLDLDIKQVIEICGSGAAGSWALSNLGHKIESKDFAPGFKVSHIRKDLMLIGEELDISNYSGISLSDTLFQKVESLPTIQGGDLGTQAMSLIYDEMIR